jgi:hypothetical protein
MKKESIVTGVIGLLLGIVIAGFAAGQAVNNNNTGMMATTTKAAEIAAPI